MELLQPRVSFQGAMSFRVICSQQSEDTAGLYYYLLAWPTPWILQYTINSIRAVQKDYARACLKGKEREELDDEDEE